MLGKNKILEALEEDQYCFLRLLVEKSLLDKEDIVAIYNIEIRVRFYEGRINGFLFVLSDNESERDRICKEGFTDAIAKLRELEVFNKLTPEQVNSIIDSIGGLN